MRLTQTPLSIASLALAIGAAVAPTNAARPYPACDGDRAKAELAKLYDNQRLLHAVSVANLQLLHDGWTGRYCVATIKWEHGLESEVKYEFDFSADKDGHEFITMWIDYNGGFRLPAF